MSAKEQYTCVCGILFEDRKEFEIHQATCPVRVKRIMETIPPHRGKWNKYIGIKEAIKPKKPRKRAEKGKESKDNTGEQHDQKPHSEES